MEKLNSSSKNFLIGVLEMGIANSFVGMNVILNKYLTQHFPIFLLLEIRYFFGIVFLFLICLSTRNKFRFYRTEERFSFSDGLIYFFMSICGGMLFNCIYMAGLHKTTAMATGIISSSIPTLIAIFSYFLLKQKIKKVHIFCVILVVIGILILNISHQSPTGQADPRMMGTLWIGNAIVFCAMIPEALFTVLAKKLRVPVFPVMSALVINVINFLLCTPMAIYQTNQFGFENVTRIAWFFSFLIGLFSSAFFYILYNRGISKIDSSTAALLTGVIPVSTACLAVIFLGESITLTLAVGMACVLSSIYVGVRFA